MKRKNVWSENGIPPLPKCTIERACELLRCKPEDIFQLCIHGCIDIKRKIFKEPAEAYSLCDKNFKDSVLDRFKSQPFNSHFLGFEGILIDGISSVEILENKRLDRANYAKITFEAIFSGWWNLLPLGHMNSYNNPEITSFELFCQGTPGPVHNIAIKLLSRDSIGLNELFIERDDLEAIYESSVTGVPLKSKYLKEEDSGQVVSIDKSKVTAKQTGMIVALLKTIGITDSDMQGSAPQFLAKVQNLAAHKSVDIPDVDEKTWREWLAKEGKR